MDKVEFGLIGGGWRAEFFLRIAEALPERYAPDAAGGSRRRSCRYTNPALGPRQPIRNEKRPVRYEPLRP
ncbi:hypothetical protein [Paenibacillus durus]|uniref:Uncharacterized protein n=1 Tax=Paenibacillus durus TaxID=44251 RepID=A0A089IR83_PAEDU|nr:hypothetical protein [Paenibacillus durus]AIQ11544.1 hypothetical protein PDUR_05975 [Paenibacillus durus]